MNVLLRFFRTINYMIVLYVVAAVAIVVTLMSQTVSEVVINFCFGGIVPGTNHVLAPSVMITAVIVGMGLIVVGILSSWLLRVVAVKQAMKHIGLNLPTLLESPDVSSSAVEATAATNALTKKASISKSPKHRSSKKDRAEVNTRTLPLWLVRILRNPSTQAVDYAWSGRLRAVLRPVQQAATTAVIYTFVALRSIVIGTMRLLTSIVFALIAIAAITGDWLLVHIRVAASTSWRLSVAVARAVASYARLYGVKFWRWMQPRAENLDTWLEIHYRAMVAWIKRQLSRSEPAQVLAMIFREIKNTIRQLFR